MFELFHAVADPGSAKVRKYVVDHELTGVITFRNVHYPEVQRDLAAHGGAVPPALWDGGRLVVGPEAIIATLVAHGDVGRAS